MSKGEQQHRDWVVKTLTAHTEKLRSINEKVNQIRSDVKVQNGRVRDLEKQVNTHKGAGIFLSCLFTALLILISVLEKS
jgi:predicted neutral ceramidase superfamily lipid hydrolase